MCTRWDLGFHSSFRPFDESPFRPFDDYDGIQKAPNPMARAQEFWSAKHEAPGALVRAPAELGQESLVPQKGMPVDDGMGRFRQKLEMCREGIIGRRNCAVQDDCESSRHLKFLSDVFIEYQDRIQRQIDTHWDHIASLSLKAEIPRAKDIKLEQEHGLHRQKLGELEAQVTQMQRHQERFQQQIEKHSDHINSLSLKADAPRATDIRLEQENGFHGQRLREIEGQISQTREGRPLAPKALASRWTLNRKTRVDNHSSSDSDAISSEDAACTFQKNPMSRKNARSNRSRSNIESDTDSSTNSPEEARQISRNDLIAKIRQALKTNPYRLKAVEFYLQHHTNDIEALAVSKDFATLLATIEQKAKHKLCKFLSPDVFACIDYGVCQNERELIAHIPGKGELGKRKPLDEKALRKLGLFSNTKAWEKKIKAWSGGERGEHHDHKHFGIALADVGEGSWHAIQCAAHTLAGPQADRKSDDDHDSAKSQAKVIHSAQSKGKPNRKLVKLPGVQAAPPSAQKIFHHLTKCSPQQIADVVAKEPHGIVAHGVSIAIKQAEKFTGKSANKSLTTLGGFASGVLNVGKSALSKIAGKLSPIGAVTQCASKVEDLCEHPDKLFSADGAGELIGGIGDGLTALGEAVPGLGAPVAAVGAAVSTFADMAVSGVKDVGHLFHWW